jgi:hypothetical protein
MATVERLRQILGKQKVNWNEMTQDIVHDVEVMVMDLWILHQYEIF